MLDRQSRIFPCWSFLLAVLFASVIAGCAGVSTQANLQQPSSPATPNSPAPSPTPTPTPQSAITDHVLLSTGVNGEVQKEFAITPNGLAQVGNDITLPTANMIGITQQMASANGFLYAPNTEDVTALTTQINAFRADLNNGIFQPAMQTTVGNNVQVISLGPTGTFLYVNDSHVIPPSEFVSELDVLRVGQDGSLTRVPGAPITLLDGGISACCSGMTTGLVFTPDGTKAYGVFGGECGECHTGPLFKSFFLTFLLDPVTGATSLVNDNRAPTSLDEILSLAVVKGGKFLLAMTSDGLNIYAIDPLTGHLTQTTTPSPVPPAVDAGDPTRLLVASKDGEFVYITDDSRGLVYGFHVEDDGTFTAVPGSPYAAPLAQLVSISNSQQFVFVVSTDGLMAFKRDSSTGALTPCGTAPINDQTHAILNLD